MAKLLLAFAVVCGMVIMAMGDACYDDAPYKKLIQNLADSENLLAGLYTAHKNDPDQGFFLEIISNIARSNEILFAIANGNSSLLDQCLTINTNIDTAIRGILDHYNISTANLTEPLIGEALFESALLNIGKSFVDILNIIPQAQAAVSQTKYQTFIVNFNSHIIAIRAAIAANDNGPACIAANNALAQDLLGILASKTDMDTMCLPATVPPTTTTAMPVTTTPQAIPVSTTTVYTTTSVASVTSPTTAAAVETTTPMPSGNGYGK